MGLHFKMSKVMTRSIMWMGEGQQNRREGEGVNVGTEDVK